jgi:hypothetical protein
VARDVDVGLRVLLGPDAALALLLLVLSDYDLHTEEISKTLTGIRVFISRVAGFGSGSAFAGF